MLKTPNPPSVIPAPRVIPITMISRRPMYSMIAPLLIIGGGESRFVSEIGKRD
jgi:hypothetical protein